MAISMDTYDEVGGIHPRNKQLPAKRLAIAGLNVAYGLTEFPTNGPFPTLLDVNQLANGIQIDISYDKPILWNSTETEGFYICLEAGVSACNTMSSKSTWQKVSFCQDYTFYGF